MFVLYSESNVRIILQLIIVLFNSADTYSFDMIVANRIIVKNDSARCLIVHSGCSIRIMIRIFSYSTLSDALLTQIERLLRSNMVRAYSGFSQ